MPSPPLSRAGNPIPERILLYGDSDAGKTYTFLKIAEWHQRRGSDARFYGLVSPGNDWEVFFGPGAEFEHLENVVDYKVKDIQDYFDLFDKKIKPNADAEDWLCVDVIADVWEAVKDEHAKKENRGKDLGTAWATAGGDYPVTGWEWGRPNARYRAFTQNRLLPFKGHLVCLSWEKDLMEASKSSGKGGEREQVRALFDVIGKKPAGQWEDYKRFRTIIHLGVNGKGQHVARTVRDKQRMGRLGELIERGTVTQYVGHPVSNFFTDYLVKIAKWTP